MRLIRNNFAIKAVDLPYLTAIGTSNCQNPSVILILEDADLNRRNRPEEGHHGRSGEDHAV